MDPIERKEDDPAAEAETERKARVVVIGIVLCIVMLPILVALFPGNVDSPVSAKRMKTRAMLNSLHLAIASFKEAHGIDPWITVHRKTLVGTATVIRELVPSDRDLTAGRTPSRNLSGRDYLALPHSMKGYAEGGGAVTLVDSWGSEYRILVDPKSGTMMIWSLGPNAIDDTLEGNPNGDDEILVVPYSN